MIRRLGILVALLTATLVTPAFGGNVELFKQTRHAAWAIYLRTPGGMNAICSAMAYKTTATETYMLSAGHCFVGTDKKRTDFLVTQDHQNFVKASFVRSGFTLAKGGRASSTDLDDYEGNDWSVIVAAIGHQAVMPIGKSSQLEIGDDILVVGVPFGLDFLAVQGIVGSKDLSVSTTVWNHYFGGNIYIASGNSGSGVISVKQRAIVGIVDAGPGGQTSMLLFMPIDLLPHDIR